MIDLSAPPPYTLHVGGELIRHFSSIRCAEVERRGAAKELRRIVDEYRKSISCDAAVGIDDLLARAAELEGA